MLNRLLLGMLCVCMVEHYTPVVPELGNLPSKGKVPFLGGSFEFGPYKVTGKSNLLFEGNFLSKKFQKG